MPDDWISPDGMHVTEAFHHYARPLIQAELTPIYIDGRAPPSASALIYGGFCSFFEKKEAEALII